MSQPIEELSPEVQDSLLEALGSGVLTLRDSIGEEDWEGRRPTTLITYPVPWDSVPAYRSGEPVEIGEKWLLALSTLTGGAFEVVRGQEREIFPPDMPEHVFDTPCVVYADPVAAYNQEEEGLGDRFFPTREEAPDIDIQALGFFREVDGFRVFGSFSFLFFPLTIDEEREEAYFKALGSVSLFWKSGFSEWTQEGRASIFWDVLANISDGEKTFSALSSSSSSSEDSSCYENIEYPPERPGLLLLDAPTMLDNAALMLALSVCQAKLPTGLGGIKTWEELEREEIIEITGAKEKAKKQGLEWEELKKEEKEELIAQGADKTEGLLKDRRLHKAEWGRYELTKKAENALLDKIGFRGFLRREGGFLYLFKRFRVIGGYFEVGLSWFGDARVLVEEKRREAEKDILEQEQNLFYQTPEGQARIATAKEKMQRLNDGGLILEYALHRLGESRTNPIELHERELKNLLECEGPRGHDRIKLAVRSLSEFDYVINAPGLKLSVEKWGPLVKDGKAQRIGRGGDWVYTLELNSTCIGCLKAFENVSPSLKNPEKRYLNYDKRLTKEQRKELSDSGGYSLGGTTLAPFFGKRFSKSQKLFFTHCVNSITRRRDATSRGREAAKVHGGTREADECRTYGPEFCPLLEDKHFGALGRFSKKTAAERGWKLGGRHKPAPSGKSGARTAGLLYIMGLWPLPRNKGRNKQIEAGLHDMQTVIEALGGVLAIRYGKKWLTLEEGRRLPPEELLKTTTRVFPFLPTDWRERLSEDYKGRHEERRQRGEVDYTLDITTDRGEYEKSVREIEGERYSEGLDEEPLHIRLYAAMKERGLKQKELAEIFGITSGALSHWFKNRKPIPRDRVQELEAWIREG